MVFTSLISVRFFIFLKLSMYFRYFTMLRVTVRVILGRVISFFFVVVLMLSRF